MMFETHVCDDADAVCDEKHEGGAAAAAAAAQPYARYVLSNDVGRIFSIDIGNSFRNRARNNENVSWRDGVS